MAKIDYAWAYQCSKTPFGECVQVPGMTNLYTHPRFPGVLFKRISTNGQIRAANGLAFKSISTGDGVYTNAAVMGYAGAALRELFTPGAAQLELGEVGVFWNGEDPRTDYGIPFVPTAIRNLGKPAKISQGIDSPYTSHCFYNGVETWQPLTSNVFEGSNTRAVTLPASRFAVMEVVTSADDGAFTTGDTHVVPGVIPYGINAGTGNGDGYLTAVLKLGTFSDVALRAKAVLRTQFPSEVAEDFDAVFEPLLAAWPDRATAVTFALTRDLRSGQFGLAHYHPLVGNTNKNRGTVVDRAMGQRPTTGNTNGGAGGAYEWGDPDPKPCYSGWWPGSRVHYFARGVHFSTRYAVPVFKELYGKIGTIDVNMLSVGLSPHLTMAESQTAIDATLFHQKSVLTLPISPWADGLWSTANSAAYEARESFEDAHITQRDLALEMAVLGGRHTIGNLQKLSAAFVDALSSEIRAHAKARS